MRLIWSLILVGFATTAVAQVQDDNPGFFDRLFRTDNADNNEDQGGFLEQLIEDQLSDAGRTVVIDGFEGALSGRATMDSLTISDGDGVWLTVTDAVLDWNRGALLRGQVEVAEITAAEVLLPRGPLASDDTAPTPEASGFNLPELPVSINIAKLAADRVFVGEPIIGAEIEASVTGAINLADGEGTAQLDIVRLDGRGNFALDGTYSNTSTNLALDLSVTEEPDGVLANLLDLPDRPSVDFQITGDAPLDEFAASVRLATDGSERLAGEITTTKSTDGRRYTTDISGDIAPVFAPDYRPFFGEQIDLDADILLQSDGELTIDRLSLQSRVLALDGSGRIGTDGLPRNFRLLGKIAAVDGQPVTLPLPGEVTQVDRIDLSLGFDAETGDDWTGRFEIAHLVRPDFSARSLTLEGAGQIVTQGTKQITANLDFEAASPEFGAPKVAEALGDDIKGTARIDWIDGQPLRLQSLMLEGGPTTLTGTAEVAFSDEGPSLTGGVNASIGDLTPYSALADRRLGGAVDVDVTFDAAPLAGTFDIAAKGEGRDISLDDPRADAVLKGVSSLDFHVRRDATGINAVLSRLESQEASLTGNATLTSGGSEFGLRGLISDASLLLDGLTGPIRLDLNGQEDDGRNWSIDANLAGTEATITANGRLSGVYAIPRFAGRATAEVPDLAKLSEIADQPLGGAIKVTLEGQTDAEFDDFDLAVDVEGTGLSTGSSDLNTLLAGDLTARLRALGSAKSAQISDLSVNTGAMTATAQGRIAQGASRIELAARLRNLADFAAGFPGPLAVMGTIEETGQSTMNIALQAEGPGGSRTSVQGTAQSDFSTAELDLNGQAPLALANRFIVPNTIAGRSDFDLRLSGPIALSSLSGRISAPGARITAPEPGIALNDVDIAVDLSGGRAELAIDGAVQDGGRFSLAGPLSLTAPYPAQLALTLRQAALSDPRLFQTDVSGTITVDGPLDQGARIAGNLTLGETEVRIPSSGLGGANAIPEIVHLNEPPPVRGTRRRAGLIGQSNGAGGGPAFPLDLTISAPNRIFVRGRGLDSEFGGALRLAGTTADVVPEGGFELIRGRLDILGRRLELDRARITMQGSFDPWIDLRASTQADEYLVIVSVIGPAGNPDITFSSDPDLPQEEVLARLIFGRGLETLSPLQAARLALAVRTLAGRGGEGVVGKIRSGTGLADLDVTTSEDGNTAVRAGAYLSENVYTDVTIDSAGETRLNLNLDLSPSVTVKGGVGNDGDTSIGIFFERDY
ncbi:MAG: hypothetical protein HKN18_06145 [Silicimonas sp.]|nr:hypothetical protein [Silicimonas sp.]